MCYYKLKKLHTKQHIKGDIHTSDEVSEDWPNEETYQDDIYIQRQYLRGDEQRGLSNAITGSYSGPRSACTLYLQNKQRIAWGIVYTSHNMWTGFDIPHCLSTFCLFIKGFRLMRGYQNVWTTARIHG